MPAMAVHIHSPLIFENVQTYCTCDWAYVGMPDLSDKPHLRETMQTMNIINRLTQYQNLLEAIWQKVNSL